MADRARETTAPARPRAARDDLQALIDMALSQVRDKFPEGWNTRRRDPIAIGGEPAAPELRRTGRFGTLPVGTPVGSRPPLEPAPAPAAGRSLGRAGVVPAGEAADQAGAIGALTDAVNAVQNRGGGEGMPPTLQVGGVAPPVQMEPQGGAPDSLLPAAGGQRSARDQIGEWMGGLTGRSGVAGGIAAGLNAASPGLGNAVGGMLGQGQAPPPAPAPGQPTPPGLGPQEDPYPAGFEQSREQRTAAAPSTALVPAGPGPSTAVTTPTTPGSLLRPGAAAGAGALGRLGEGTIDEMIEDPEFALQDAFMDMGIDPTKNRYANTIVKKYAPVFDELGALYAAVSGVDSSDPEAARQWFPQFLQYFMGGGDVSGLVQRALSAADENPALKQALIEIGPEGLSAIMSRTSGESPLLSRARGTLATRSALQRRREEQAAAEQNKDLDPDRWFADYQRQNRR